MCAAGTCVCVSCLHESERRSLLREFGGAPIVGPSPEDGRPDRADLLHGLHRRGNGRGGRQAHRRAWESSLVLVRSRLREQLRPWLQAVLSAGLAVRRSHRPPAGPVVVPDLHGGGGGRVLDLREHGVPLHDRGCEQTPQPAGLL